MIPGRRTGIAIGLLLCVLHVSIITIQLASCDNVASHMDNHGTMPGKLSVEQLIPITSDNASDLSLITQMGKGAAKCIAWPNKDNELIVVTARGVFTYDIASLQLVHFVPIALYGPCLEITPDGEFFAIERPDKVLQIWNGKTGRSVHEIALNPKSSSLKPGMVTLSPSGHWLALQAEIRVTELWDLSTGKAHHSFDSLGISSAIDSNDRLLAINSPDRAVEVWNIETLEIMHILPITFGQSFDFSPTGELLVVQNEGVAYLWNLETFVNEVTITVSPTPQMLPNNGTRFTPDGLKMLSVNVNNITLWDARTGEILMEYNSQTRFTQTSISPDGNLLAAMFGNYPGYGDVVIRELETGDEFGTISGHAFVADLEFHPSKPLLAVGWNTDSTWVVDIAQGTTDFLRSGQYDKDNLVTFSQDGGLLAVGGSDGIINLWDMATKELQHSLKGKGPVNSLSFRSDGMHLAIVVGHWEGESWTKMLNVDTGTFDKGGCYGCDEIYLFSPTDNDLVARGDLYSINLDKEGVRNWGHALWASEQAGDYISNEFYCMTYNATGTMLAAGVEHKILIWDTATRQRLLTLDALTQAVDVVFSPDGSLLASSNDNDSVYLWNAETGELIVTIPQYRISSLDFSADGKVLAIGGREGIVSLYAIEQ